MLDFIANPQKLSDDDVMDLINGQLMIADSVEDLDELQKQISLTPEYLIGLGIKDYEKINSLIEKIKIDKFFKNINIIKKLSAMFWVKLIMVILNLLVQVVEKIKKIELKLLAYIKIILTKVFHLKIVI